jgi:deoxyadenosine/deoxycytidine kinase
MPQQRHIAVDGPIGVGKTSLATALARRLDGDLILEDDNNPFLAPFYDDRPGAAFQAQLFFLLTRHGQLLELRQRSLFRPLAVTDYLFAKDRIFAHINLSDDELLIYERLYRILEPDLPRPDLVIYLQASSEVLLQRIRTRRRDFERRIDPDYVNQVNEAYSYFFYHYRASPLLVINTNDIDFVKRPGDLEELIQQIELSEGGTRFFAPPSSGENER